MNKIGRTKEIPRIIVPQGAQKHIASHFGVSGETVRRALKYIINTELAVRIREEAIKNYGGAEYLGISQGALRKRVHDGTIPYTKKGKLLYFSKQDVNKYLLDK